MPDNDIENAERDIRVSMYADDRQTNDQLNAGERGLTALVTAIAARDERIRELEQEQIRQRAVIHELRDLNVAGLSLGRWHELEQQLKAAQLNHGLVVTQYEDESDKLKRELRAAEYKLYRVLLDIQSELAGPTYQLGSRIGRVVEAAKEYFAKHSTSPSSQLDKLLRESGVQIKFGLRAQGHIPTIQKMLAEGATWDEIGEAIGWSQAAAKEWYERELEREL